MAFFLLLPPLLSQCALSGVPVGCSSSACCGAVRRGQEAAGFRRQFLSSLPLLWFPRFFFLLPFPGGCFLRRMWGLRGWGRRRTPPCTFCFSLRLAHSCSQTSHDSDNDDSNSNRKGRENSLSLQDWAGFLRCFWAPVPC